VLVGRREELHAVRSAVAGGRLLAIAGPAGIGKSTLARAGLGRGPHRSTGALASLAWHPLLPFRRLLDADRLTADASPEVVARAVLRDPATPLLLDDLQWADDASLEVVRGLVGRIPIVVTIRDGEERSAEVTDLVALLGGVLLRLGPLPEAAADEVVAQAHPQLDGDGRRAVVAIADGNPLLLRELPRGPAASPSLVGALLQRLGDLSPVGRGAVERLAVLGRPARPEELGGGAAEVVASGLAAGADGRIEIVHALLAEVIASELGARADAVRRDLAGRVPPAEAAHLLAEAGDRDGARTLALVATQGEVDRRLRAELLELAVRCTDDLDLDRRIEAARLLTATSQPARALALCEVDGIDDLPPLVRGTLRGAAAEAAWLQGDHERFASLARLALEEVQGTGTEVEVLVLAGTSMLDTFVDLDGRAALGRAEAAVALADELGASRAFARMRLAAVRMTSGLDGWEELGREAMALAREAGEADLHRHALVGLVLHTWAAGDVQRAERVAAADLAASAREGLDLGWLGQVALASVLGLLAGRPLVELIDRGAPLLGQEPSFRNRSFLEGSVIVALADVGRHADAARLLEDASSRPGDAPHERSIVAWAAVEAAWLAGRTERALELVAGLLELPVGDHPSAVSGRLVGGHAAVALGRPLLGARPGPMLPAWSGAPIEWEALELASAGDLLAASTAFERAASAWERSDVRSDLRCRWAAGATLVAEDPERAEGILATAEAQAVQLGAVAMGNRIRRSLRSVGSRRRSAGHVRSARVIAGLTEREAEVLDLVGAGLSTPSIADALGLEASTVETFVRSAVGKLGSSTRVAAAAELARRRSAQLS
jgi:DNA-binding CsgD family transcriptional regulator/energy-coupling factor transporter ATP-binding protein EcfA2